MVSSKYFSIDEGPNAGVFCKYCGEKIAATTDEDSGGFYYRCTCDDARAEIILLEQQHTLNQKLEKFYTQRDKQMKRTQLVAHHAALQYQLKDISKALEDLTDDDESDRDSTLSSSEEEGDDSLKMERPKLPSFNIKR